MALQMAPFTVCLLVYEEVSVPPLILAIVIEILYKIVHFLYFTYQLVSYDYEVKYSVVSCHKCYLSSAQNLISEWNFKASVLNFFSFTNSLKKVFL